MPIGTGGGAGAPVAVFCDNLILFHVLTPSDKINGHIYLSVSKNWILCIRNIEQLSKIDCKMSSLKFS